MNSESSGAVADSDPPETLQSLMEKASNLGVELKRWFWDMKEEDRIDFLKDQVKKTNQIQRMDEQIQRQHELLHQISLQFAYGQSNENDGFWQLPLAGNDRVIPSVGGNKRTTTIKDDNGEDKKVTMMIPEAKNIVTVGENMWAKIETVKIPCRESGEPITSGLAAKFQKTGLEKKFSYANEFDVQALCRLMVEDSLFALGLTEEYVRSHLEISIYLMKPDIVLVLRRGGRIFFAIEVKSPETPKQKVFTSKHVGGQIWSYLYAMKAAGDEQPMGAIMTFDKIALVTLDDYSDDEQHRKAVTAAQDALSTGTAIKLGPEEPDRSCEERDDSPVKTGKSVSSTNRDYEETKREILDKKEVTRNEEIWDKEEEVTRNVYYSKVHEKGNVFPCLLQALHIAYHKATGKCSPYIPCISDGEKIGRRLSFKVGQHSFRWVKLPSHKNKQPFTARWTKNIPSMKSTEFHFLGKLGEGQSASVYLCCNTSGRVCAIKEYFLRPSSAVTEELWDTEEIEERGKLYYKAMDEKARWDKLYNGSYSAGVKTLGGKSTLLMPYGREIVSEAPHYESRWKCIPAIQAHLQRFANEGYIYDKSDLRWRHVLLDCNNEIFLCDLESLKEITGADKKDAVYEQLEVLLKPLVKDQSLDISDTQAWLCKTKVDEVIPIVTGNDVLCRYFNADPDADLRSCLESLVSTTRFDELPAWNKVSLRIMAHFKVSAQDPSTPGSSSRKRKELPATSGNAR
mmetsp:Transcript_35862/g.74590  ORF Transcript_35862/g.74590 Transcript_35862/m.74590 type:complete len:739 (-) Transcript_35862:1458-3674(-)